MAPVYYSGFLWSGLKVCMRLAQHFDADGLWVGIIGREPVQDAILAKLRQAFDLLKEYDPFRYRLLLREIDLVWVNVLADEASAMVAGRRAVILDERAASREPVERIAAMVVHEAASARMNRRGVRLSDYVRRQRYERACMRQELAFAARVPGGAELIASIEGRMARPAEFWAMRSIRQRNAAGEAEAARYLGAPGWLVSAGTAFRSWRTRVRTFLRRLRSNSP